MLDKNRLVLEPGVALIAYTAISVDGYEDALALAGVTDVSEQAGTPLNQITGRVYNRLTEFGGDEFSGAGDDLAEFAGRQCYRSWSKGREQAEYISNVINECHGSIFRHANLTFQITGVSRALTHELVRHGIGTAPSQESQRYVDAKDIRFVVPPITAMDLNCEEDLDSHPEMVHFRTSCQRSLDDYITYQAQLKERLKALNEAGDYKGATSYQKRANEAARALLPNATETRLVFSMNLQSMRHILSLRGTEYADLEIRRLAVVLLEKARAYAPAFFAEVVEALGSDNLPIIQAKNGKL
jgi:thymidylate synthase (FAD)